ncbi:hypothetical protein H5410_049679 [Solanum commersonii]|uniref:Uncharacterized protein n=1 Tax=Solanum commersonii TaxID=4109 RepID=A0A9J5WVC5_SOLCO|nr:hypothetical protein H5410_049679 [Solanum commersonii]
MASRSPPTPLHVHTNLHPQTPLSLQPSGSTQFKKRNKQKSKRLKEAIINFDVEWVCPTHVESASIAKFGLPSFTAQPNLHPHLPPEELASVTKKRAQE